jgi:hypothetical protein
MCEIVATAAKNEKKKNGRRKLNGLSTLLHFSCE